MTNLGCKSITYSGFIAFGTLPIVVCVINKGTSSKKQENYSNSKHEKRDIIVDLTGPNDLGNMN